MGAHAYARAREETPIYAQAWSWREIMLTDPKGLARIRKSHYMPNMGEIENFCTYRESRNKTQREDGYGVTSVMSFYRRDGHTATHCNTLQHTDKIDTV